MTAEQVGRRADAARLTDPDVERFLTIWWFTGIAAAAMVLLSFEVAVTAADLPAVAGLTVLAALTHLSSISFRFGRSSESANIVEASLVVVLLTLPPIGAFGAVLVGVLLSDLIRRLPASKVAFNAASNAAGLGLAIGTVQVLRAGAAPGSGRGLVAVAVAAVLYGVVNFLAVTRIVSLVEQTGMWDKVRRGWHFLVSTFVSTGIGLLAAVLWAREPLLLTLLAIPLLTAGRIYRGLARQRRQHALTRRELDRVARVLSSTTDGIALLDENAEVEIWNSAMGTLTGRDAASAVGRPVGDVLSLRDGDGIEVDLRRVVAGFVGDPAPWSGELILDRSREEPIQVRVTVSVSDDGEVGRPGAVLVVSDLTEVRQADRAKDDFLMRITHELRTPLTPIKGYAESLRAHAGRIDPTMLDHALGRIADRADQLTALIDDLLLVAAASHPGHQRQTTRRPVDIVERVRLVVDLAATRRGRTVTVDVDAGSALCLGDPLRIDRVVAVLIENAMTYSEPDSPIEVSITATADAIDVAVTDHGLGIDAGQLDAIFERFHRVENPLVMTTGGLGIGLYLARRFAASMDGSLDVVSELGRGSTFTLRLPAFRAVDRSGRSASLV